MMTLSPQRFFEEVCAAAPGCFNEVIIERRLDCWDAYIVKAYCREHR